MTTLPRKLLLLIVGLSSGCAGAPATSPTPIPTTPTATVQATAAPTPQVSATVAPSPAATATAAPVTVNADGSVFIRPPLKFDFAQPGDGAIWGLLQEPGVGQNIVRIDPVTYEIETVVTGLPFLPNPVSPVAHNGSIWLASWDKSSVTQYDAETGDEIREIEVGFHPIEPVVAYDDVWTLNHHGDSVTRIDSHSGEAYPAIDLPGAGPLSLTVVSDELMLVQGPGPLIYAVNPREMTVLGHYDDPVCFEERGASRGAMVAGTLWRKYCDSDEVAIVDPATGQVVESFESPAIPYQPLVVDGNLWMPFAADNGPGIFGLIGLHPVTHEEIGRYEQDLTIREGSSVVSFDSWWRWGWEGLLRVPADTLRAAVAQ